MLLMHIIVLCNSAPSQTQCSMQQFVSQVGGESDVELRGFMDSLTTTCYGIVQTEMGFVVLSE